MFKFRPVNGLLNATIYHPGDRVGQLLILPYPQIEIAESGNLSDTDRGEGGFGSTGK
jgi:dUTP pyrophosphatase